MLYQPAPPELEPIEGQSTAWLLDRHPDGRHVACQGHYYGRYAGVWDLETGKLVWAPEDTIAIAWIPSGREVVLIRKYEQDYPEKLPIIARVAWREYPVVFERRSWPEQELLSRCAIRPPHGSFEQLVVSPRGDLAAVWWNEHGRAGYELVQLHNGRDQQVSGKGYSGRPDYVDNLVFSPDGGYLVSVCGYYRWWAEYEEDEDTPLKGDTYQIGHIAIQDMDTFNVRELRVWHSVPEGWLPDDTWEYVDFGIPEFLNHKEFTVALPNGVKYNYTTDPSLMSPRTHPLLWWSFYGQPVPANVPPMSDLTHPLLFWRNPNDSASPD